MCCGVSVCLPNRSLTLLPNSCLILSNSFCKRLASCLTSPNSCLTLSNSELRSGSHWQCALNVLHRITSLSSGKVALHNAPFSPWINPRAGGQGHRFSLIKLSWASCDCFLVMVGGRVFSLRTPPRVTLSPILTAASLRDMSSVRKHSSLNANSPLFQTYLPARVGATPLQVRLQTLLQSLFPVLAGSHRGLWPALWSGPRYGPVRPAIAWCDN